jgi:hypothetical protein
MGECIKQLRSEGSMEDGNYHRGLAPAVGAPGYCTTNMKILAPLWDRWDKPVSAREGRYG